MAHVGSTAAGNASGSTVTVTPSGYTIEDNHIIVAIGATYTSSYPVTLPTGFTAWDNLTNGYYYRVGWKRANSESGGYEFGSGGGASETYGAISVYSGRVTTGDPLDQISNTLYNVNDVNVRAADMTIGTADSDLVWLAIAYSGSISVPSGMNDRISGYYGDAAIGIADLLSQSTGATGDKDGTIASARSTYKHAFMVSLKPAAGGSGLVIPVAAYHYAQQ